jgi:hypothetical protein
MRYARAVWAVEAVTAARKGDRRIMGPPRRFPLCGWILAAALLSVSLPVRAETSGTLTGRLDEAIRQVEAAREGGGPLADPGALFPEIEEAAGPGGMMQVDHASLRAEWKSIPAEGKGRGESLERLRHRLLAVRAEMTPAGIAGGPQPLTGWREKLSQILSRPEFEERQPEEDWRVRVMQWLRQRVGSLFPRATTRMVGGALSGILYVLAGVTLLIVLVLLVRVALPLLMRDRGTARTQAPAKIETPESLLALADARTRAGDLRGAAQALFRWMLLGLHRAGRLEFDPALTNREHLARLRTDSRGRAAFERLSRQFELVWYGFQPVLPEDLAAFRVECQRLAGGRA